MFEEKNAILGNQYFYLMLLKSNSSKFALVDFSIKDSHKFFHDCKNHLQALSPISIVQFEFQNLKKMLKIQHLDKTGCFEDEYLFIKHGKA